MFQNKRLYVMFTLVLVSALFSAGFTTRASAINLENRVECIPQKINVSPAYQSVCQNMQPKLEELKKKKEAEEKARARAETRAKAKAKARAKAEAAAKRREQEKLLASIIFCEAGNQSYTGQVAVGAVVMNRLGHSSYPNSLEGVIYQKGQFTPASTGWLDKVRNSGGYTDSALKAAKDALNGANPIGDCLFFDRGGSGMKIGDHFFH